MTYILSLHDALPILNRYEKLNQELKSEIIADRQQNSILGKRIMKLEKENRNLIKKQDRLTTNLKETMYELNNMKKSSSWKVTKPLRNRSEERRVGKESKSRRRKW